MPRFAIFSSPADAFPLAERRGPCAGQDPRKLTRYSSIEKNCTTYKNGGIAAIGEAVKHM